MNNKKTALAQLVQQTGFTMYRMAKICEIPLQTFSYQNKKNNNLDFAIKVLKILSKKGVITENIILTETFKM
jgi:hypothetical protein